MGRQFHRIFSDSQSLFNLNEYKIKTIRNIILKEEILIENFGMPKLLESMA